MFQRQPLGQQDPRQIGGSYFDYLLLRKEIEPVYSNAVLAPAFNHLASVFEWGTEIRLKLCTSCKTASCQCFGDLNKVLELIEHQSPLLLKLKNALNVGSTQILSMSLLIFVFQARSNLSVMLDLWKHLQKCFEGVTQVTSEKYLIFNFLSQFKLIAEFMKHYYRMEDEINPTFLDSLLETPLKDVTEMRSSLHAIIQYVQTEPNYQEFSDLLTNLHTLAGKMLTLSFEKYSVSDAENMDLVADDGTIVHIKPLYDDVENIFAEIGDPLRHPQRPMNQNHFFGNGNGGNNNDDIDGINNNNYQQGNIQHDEGGMEIVPQ